MKYFNHSDFNLNQLMALKKEKRLTVGVCLPVKNEEKTLGMILKELKSAGGLVDKIIVIDSGSTDNSETICENEGVDFIKDTTSSKELGVDLRRGKGWNLWSSLYYLNTDLVIWLDADIENYTNRFLYGAVGPMLVSDEIQFVKGFYDRPKADARVTEIMARPIISLLIPELAEFIQPLAGEYGARKTLLEKLEFSSGYSVEMIVLYNALKVTTLNEIAQVNMGERIHELQDVPSLGKMSFAILKQLLIQLDTDKKLRLDIRLHTNFKRHILESGKLVHENLDVGDIFLPKMCSVKNYKQLK